MQFSLLLVSRDGSGSWVRWVKKVGGLAWLVGQVGQGNGWVDVGRGSIFLIFEWVNGSYTV